jgi:hypothetical protein
MTGETYAPPTGLNVATRILGLLLRPGASLGGVADEFDELHAERVS